MITATPTLDEMDDPALPSMEESAHRFERLISPRTGLVSQVLFTELDPDDPPLHWAIATPANAEVAGMRRTLAVGSAVAADQSRATMKALGESIERYCSAQWETADLTIASYRELTVDAVDPRTFALFSDEQQRGPEFPWLPFTEATTIPWVQGMSLVRGTPVLVPAPFVYVPFGPQPNDRPIWMSISTGLACGPSLAHAAYRALLEQIERDAFMIVWRNQLARPQIDLTTVKDPTIRRLVAAYADTSFRCHAVVLTLDIAVTVVLGLLSSKDGQFPLTAVGLGVDLNPRRALQLALEELSLGFMGMRRLVAESPEWRPTDEYRELDNVTLHGHAHAVDSRLQAATEFLQRGELLDIRELPDRSSASAKGNLATVVSDISSLGLDVITFDLTTNDVDEAGFKVVRAVVPGLQPLDTNHVTQYHGGRRLYDVAVQLGLREGPLSPLDLNPLPHPFP